ncbi:MAG TPA: SpoIID/LytB domain-containing protein, partial [Actinomycetota bacterium]|nr:SpoIID/LytB domain-containing protein [Actinomycetota bacterium]
MRRSLAILLTLCFFAALPVAPARAALVPMPSDGTILIPGHGWGHGRGMGQWGAKGMAQAGKSYDDIVGHYYSDVQMGTRSTSETIRVLVEQSSDVVVTADDTFTVVGSTGSTLATSSDAYPFIRVKYDGSQYRYEKAASHAGPWSLIRTSGAYGIFQRGSRLLQLVFTTGGVRYYRGSIIARYSSSRGMMAINELLMQEYLYGVVPRESPASWPAEALKSQSVAARTYSAYKKDYQRSKGYAFDICATTSCQVYGGYAYKTCMTCARQDLEYASTNKAIDDTAGQTLLYDGKPILAEYSSSTGGYTAQGNVPYQKAVPDSGDTVSPHHEWRATVSVADVQNKWPQIGKLVEINITDRNGFGEWGGRVQRMELVGTLDTISITGSAWRSAFQWPSRSNGVRSTWFTALYWNGELVSAPSSISIPAGETATLPVQVRNTGNVKWPVGGSVRIATGSPSRFAGDSWISTTRAASVARNVT